MKKINLFILSTTNYKDIGILYLLFGFIAGIIGTIFSIIIRVELVYPGIQILYISFNKDFHIMLAYRNEVSIFFILIKKSFLNFINIKNIIKWYVYSFYMIYVGLLVSISCLFDIKIISYNYLIKKNKIIQIHEAA